MLILTVALSIGTCAGPETNRPEMARAFDSLCPITLGMTEADVEILFLTLSPEGYAAIGYSHTDKNLTMMTYYPQGLRVAVKVLYIDGEVVKVWKYKKR